MEPRRKPIRRKTTVVNRRLQYTFATQILVAQIIVVLTYQAFIQLRFSAHMNDAKSVEEWTTLSSLMTESLYTLLGVGLVTSVLLFLLGLWLSNRVVGPVPRLRRAMHAAAEGNFNIRLKFRPGDLLEELAGDYNRLMEAVVVLEERCKLAEAKLGRPAEGFAEPDTKPVETLLSR